MEQKENRSKDKIWQERLEDFAASGMSQREWCQHQNISVTTLRYWKRKLQSGSSAPSEGNWMTVVPESPMFPSVQNHEITIQQGDIKIVILPTVDPQLGYDLLQVLMQR